MSGSPTDDPSESTRLPVDPLEHALKTGESALDGLVPAQHRREAVERIFEALQIGVTVQQSAYWSQYRGKIPPPEMIEHYERIQPGMADRLLRMAERSQEAEIASVGDVNRRTDRYQLLALGAGFVGLLVILVFAYALATESHDWVAGGVLGIGVSGIIATLVNAPFLTNRRRPDVERETASTPSDGVQTR